MIICGHLGQQFLGKFVGAEIHGVCGPSTDYNGTNSAQGPEKKEEFIIKTINTLSQVLADRVVH